MDEVLKRPFALAVVYVQDFGSVNQSLRAAAYAPRPSSTPTLTLVLGSYAARCVSP